MLSLAVVFSFMPFFTLQADAFSTGATTLVKTRTVTIQPGKTYKFPVVKLSKKKAFQVPVNIKVSKKSKKSQISKGGYILKIKNSKGKLVSSYKTSLKYVGKYDDQSYTDWIYFYKKSISKPCFDKGKYYFSIKNTSNCAIRVKYSVKGYTKFASNADFVEDMTVDYNNDTDFKYIYMLPYKYVGRIGPGIPAISSITSSNEAVYADGWFLTHDGKLYLYLDTDEKEADTVISVKLKNNKTPYKINAKVIGYYYEEEDDEPIDDGNTAPAE
jgi:hypothetical protein